MNQSTVLGMVCALVVFGVAAFTATQSPQVFLDPHGILIVMGGTTAAALICFPMRTLGNLFQVFARKVLGKYSGRNELVIEECCDLSRGYREDDGYLANKSKELKTPFLRDLVELIVQGGVSNEQLHDIMHKRTETHSERYEEEAEIFKTLSKFPPAFGLMATTLGMISMMQKMGSPDSLKLLGPSMAIGLVGTLYGILLANFVFIPIGENLTKLNRDDQRMRKMVLDGVQLVKEKTHPLVVQEYLMAYMLPAERERFKKKAGAAAGG